ncbi:phage tail assembly chaperone [Paucibacter sp. R3-3]|uniref:Phage tail assembly chaperone n=1 Tax=Roseateles agri TaxID=3098619 RepID=A0ABU5DJU4_9BURK|nr:phage tail assembly chaperone [Paucibacter sp. R3-3]MDY0746569.1 phage tail assembly chaperone [Paucibacter sp. R3-3]
MSKPSIKAAPTFTAEVKIPRPEGPPLVIKFDFKHRGRKEFAQFRESLEGSARVDHEVMMDIACGWHDVEEPFSAKAVKDLLDGHHQAARAITDTYIAELTQVGRPT